MSKVDDFLRSLDKYEISFLYKYKFDEYISDTKQKILSTLQKLQLTDSQMEKLMKERINEPFDSEFHKQCVRCKSKKLFAFSQDVNHESIYSTVDKPVSGNMQTEQIIKCAICGYNPNEGIPEGVEITSPGIKYDRRRTIIIGIVIIVVLILYTIITGYLGIDT